MGEMISTEPIPSNTKEGGLRDSPRRADVKYIPAQEPWDLFRPVKVIITGAGIGGVASAVLISKKVRNSTVTVYDKADRIGGTWAWNTYPGVRCDVPSHAYQLSFEPNTDWTEYYPKGEEIQQYYERVIHKYQLSDSVHLQHEVLKATWDSSTSEWEVLVQNLHTGQIFADRADFFVSCQGRISQPKSPDIDGLANTFEGDIIHTARWKKDYNLQGKRVAVIGNGASAQQLIPNIIKDVSGIDHYVRTKTWVTPTFAGDLHEANADSPGGPKYTEEERRIFREDPKAYLEHRRNFELKFQFRLSGDKLGSKENEELRQNITKCMLERLGGDEEWLKRVIPDYAPGCKRLTPAPGYLEALQDPKVAYITEKILRADRTGLITMDGKHHEVDTIVTATGFSGGFTTRFPILGKDGVDLRDKWSPDGPVGYPESYMGVMAPGYPNYFTVLQAQGNARGGTVPLHIEISATYIAKCIRKVQSQSYASLNPREDATEDFNDIVNGYFDGKVTGDKCNSWFKLGKGNTRVLIAWPGSFHHRAAALRDPRWEDFEFVRRSGAQKNRFEYFGNGWTERERLRDEDDLTKYLKEVGKIDIELLHEPWNE